MLLLGQMRTYCDSLLCKYQRNAIISRRPHTARKWNRVSGIGNECNANNNNLDILFAVNYG